MAKMQIILAKTTDPVANTVKYMKDVAKAVAADPAVVGIVSPKAADIILAAEEIEAADVSERLKSQATNEILDEKLTTGIDLFTAFLASLLAAKGGDVASLKDYSVKLPEIGEKRPRSSIKPGSPNVESHRMGKSKGEYYFRLTSKSDASVIAIYRKNDEDVLEMIDVSDSIFIELDDQPSGSQTYAFRGKRGKNWGPFSAETTVNVP